MRIRLGVFGVAMFLTACSGGQSTSPDPDPASRTTPAVKSDSAVAAQRTLLGLPRPRGGDVAGGSYTFGDTFDNNETQRAGLLASVSWDAYYRLDENQRMGAWGAGLDVYDTLDGAAEDGHRMANWTPCRGPVRALWKLPAGDAHAFFETHVCRRARAEDPRFIATAAVAEQVDDRFSVAANVTASGISQAEALTALEAMWASVDPVVHLTIKRLADAPPS